MKSDESQFDASDLRRRSILTEDTERDPLTGDEKVIPGAIQKYEEAFAIWADLLKQYPVLRESAVFKDIVEIIQLYRVVREAAGMDDWPDDFALQEVIDYRALNLPSSNDELPTSQQARNDFMVRQAKSTSRMPIRPSIEFSMDEFKAQENADQ